MTVSAQFAYRSAEGVSFAASVPQKAVLAAPAPIPQQNTRCIVYSPDGSRFAYSTPDRVVVLDPSTGSVLRELAVANVVELSFSPKAAFLSTFERLTKPKDGSQHKNVNVWALDSGNCVFSFSHKNQETWKLQWTDDESIVGKMVSNEVQFFASKIFSALHSKLRLENIAEFSLSPGKNPSVAAFVPEHKGNPAIVRLYALNSFNFPLSNKTFFKADHVQFTWNQIGTNVLVLTQTETDRTGQSYYGETNLYYLSAVGNYDCRVTLDAEGPIHDLVWGPSSNEFVVVYGNMPAKAALFDSRANKVFDFGASPKNFVRYSPKGRLIMMAGFGNLAGYVEVWDRKLLVKVAQFKEDAATFCEFAPDGLHILTATLSPRLRVDNRFRIRNYHGQILWQMDFKELFNVAWRPVSSSDFPEEDLAKVPLDKSIVVVDTATAKKEVPVARAYVPPHLRNRVSGSASSIPGLPPGAGKPAQAQKQAQKKPEPASVTVKAAQPANGALTSTVASQVAEVQKKILGVTRKLRQIEELKQKQAEGKTLEKNQIEKLAQEAQFRESIAELEQQLKQLGL